MNLTGTRRLIRLGQYAAPAVFLSLAAVAWSGPTSCVCVAVPLGAGVSALAIWLLLRSADRWLDRVCASQSELGDQLIQSQKVLALGEISTGIAHEINNPLNIIMQEAELMRADLEEEGCEKNLDEVRGSLDVIIQQVERCSDITHKLLDFARKRVPVTQFADINRLVEDMLDLLERGGGPRNVQIVKTYDEHMPGVRTDPPLLRQVFLNLLINAVQAVGEGGMIYVTTYRDGTMACVEIRDTGPGIAEEDLERIFHPFFTTKEPGRGTGLGLSVSLRIITQLGGDVSVRSEPGRGAAFTVRIPINTWREQ
jgi:signal transduction histidine kinase